MAQSNDTLSVSLQQHLHDIAKSEGFRDYTIEHKAGSQKGDGFMSTMLAVTLVGTRQLTDGTQRPDRLSLVCKLQPANVSHKEQFQSGLLFERESLVYSQILPALEEFQIAKGLAPKDRFSAYPKCYLAQPQTSTGDAIIIMQDMRSTGFVLRDKWQPLQFANAMLLVEQLGLLHGVSVALHQQKPELFAKWAAMPDHYGRFMRTKPMQSMLISELGRAIGLLENPRHIAILKKFQREHLSIFHDCMDAKALGALAVMCHGDSWYNNMMYGPQDKSIILLDWQLSRVASPAVDLIVFICSATDKSLRDQHLDELIRLYYAKFAEIIRLCGSNPDTLYTFDDLQAQLKSHSVHGVLLSPFFISASVSEANDMVDMDEMAENFENQVHQEENWSKFSKKSQEMYVQRMSDILDDAIKYGWMDDYYDKE